MEESGLREYIKGHLDNRGLKMLYLIEKVSMSRPSFYKKLDEPGELTINNITEISNILGINFKELLDEVLAKSKQ